MPHNDNKEWLVRTRMGEVLGPFTQRELYEELQKKSFSGEDEIAPSMGSWVSAQALIHRDSDEFTMTSTRSQAITRSYQTAPGTGAGTEAGTPTPTPTETPSDLDSESERTPAPYGDLRQVEPPPVRRLDQIPRVPRGTRIGPLVSLAFAVAGLWLIVSHFRSRQGEQPDSATSTPPPPPATISDGTESPISHEVNELIRRGETQEALRRLTRHHEQNPSRNDLEYLIPYSALLILEGETTRARKFLEQVLISPSANVRLKARAHHWMGYIMLAEDIEDRGEAHFIESLQLNPKDAAARFNLGRAYLKAMKYSQALDYLQLAELEMPDLWLIQIYKGRAKGDLGNQEEARNSFKTAVQMSPDRWLAHIYYAVFLMGISETEAAQSIMKRMLTRDPHFELHSPQPLGYFQEKVNYVDYLKTFNYVMNGASGEEKEIGKLYINYLLNGTAGNEGRRIEAAAAKGGVMTKVLALKVVLDRDSSNDEIRTAVNRLPANLNEFGCYAYVLRGTARMRLSQFVEALQDIQRALALEPKAAVANWALAILLRKSQRPQEAAVAMKTLLGYHPHYIPAIVSCQ